ncbi:hypothetical protein [Motiliproteus sp. SC1-56]|uniref:hypothetical protein n=1 Tax=Motiliproteus sp. SC1-56 TaxID=2799565 RepID=UPI001A8DF42E|nr:hypothetical protein [Motiliproteus sp. SC1-56]
MTDKQSIRADRHLQWMMRLGLPLAAIAIASLWLGRALESPGIGLLFFIALPLALAIGFAYNIRYIILAHRQRKADTPPSR